MTNNKKISKYFNIILLSAEENINNRRAICILLESFRIRKKLFRRRRKTESSIRIVFRLSIRIRNNSNLINFAIRRTVKYLPKNKYKIKPRFENNQ